MAKRSFERTNPSRTSVLDVKTGKPVNDDIRTVVCAQIRKYREQLHLEQRELARLINITPSAVSNWENGRSRPDINLLPEICEVLHITLYELFMLDEPASHLTEPEEALVDKYRLLTNGHQRTVRNLVDSLIDAQAEAQCPQLRRFLYFEHGLAAGIGDPSDYDDAGTPFYLYQGRVASTADAVFRVSGDSMEPTYHDGQKVLVNRACLDLKPGDIGAFMIANETYIKEFQPDGLHSHNRRYAPMKYSEFDNVYLIGKVVGAIEDADVATQDDVTRYLRFHPDQDDSSRV